MKNKNNSRSALVFDLDGTLINSNEKLISDVIEAFYRLDVVITPEEAKTDWYKLAGKYGISKEQFDNAFNKRKSWEASIKDGKVTIFPETLETLERLRSRGIRMGLLSLSIPEYTKTKLDCFNLSPYFEQIETVDPKNGRDKNQGAINITRRLNPSLLRYIGFIGDNDCDVSCEKAVRDAYQKYQLTTGGIYINRNGGKTLKGYPTIKSLEEIFNLI